MASKPELVLAQQRLVGAEARLLAAPPPRRFDPRLADYLREKGGAHVLARMQFETALEDELVAQIGLARERLFGLAEQEERARVDQNAHAQMRAGLRAGDAEGMRQSDREAQRIAAELQEIGEQVAAVRARERALSSRAWPLAERLRRCRERIAAAMRGGEPLRFIALPVPDKKLGLDAARERVSQLRADEREILAAPRSVGEVKQALVAWLDREACAPNIQNLFDAEGEASVYLGGKEVGGRWEVNALGLMLWLGRDEIIRRLSADADQLGDDGHALDAVTRAKKLAECRAQILAAERLEESVAWRLMQDGAEIVLRGDCAVRAILSVE